MQIQTQYYDIGNIPQTTSLAERFMFPFSEINYLVNGGILDRITLITSGTDNGKSTIASQILESVIKEGYKAFAFFGEDSWTEARDRLYRQSAMKEDFNYQQYVSINGKNTNCGEYLLSDSKWQEINDFYKGNLYLYNNNITPDKHNLLAILEKAYNENACRVFLLDNVEMFQLDTDNENAGVKEICIQLRQFAINRKCHIIVIAHIKKTERGLIRPDVFDVKGTSTLTNIAKNIITAIRTDKLDKESKEYKSFKRILELHNWDLDEADGVLEVRKTKGRGYGFCCLKYNHITNSYYECKKLSDTQQYKPKSKNKPEQYSLENLKPVEGEDLPF